MNRATAFLTILHVRPAKTQISSVNWSEFSPSKRRSYSKSVPGRLRLDCADADLSLRWQYKRFLENTEHRPICIILLLTLTGKTKMSGIKSRFKSSWLTWSIFCPFRQWRQLLWLPVLLHANTLLKKGLVYKERICSPREQVLSL